MKNNMLRSQKSEVRSQNIELRRVLLCCLVCGLWCILGCQKGGGAAAAGDVRRAQIVGNENIQLKKTIVEKDAEIVDLNKQIKSLQTKIGELEMMNVDVYKGLMQNLLDCSTKLETYEKESENIE